jgi:hypothetical protein
MTTRDQATVTTRRGTRRVNPMEAIEKKKEKKKKRKYH